MIPFLHSVAKGYASRYSDLSEFCFLFPNKRSGTFFLKYLKKETAGHVMLSPKVMTISELVGKLSERVVAGRLDLLFLLFEAYRDISGATPGNDDSGVEFDSFRGWGETVLSDFSEVDQYLVDAQAIFKNVKDYRELSSNFLTDEQKEVMAEYFGRTSTGDTSGFWKNFDCEDDKLSEAKHKFIHLWRVMYPLYEALNAKLEEKGMATTGGAYRKAVEAILEKGRGLLPYKKVVAVGFNALSASESTIFRELRDMEPYPGFDTYADFFWDMTGPVLTSGENSASKFVMANIKMFPCPQWGLPFLELSKNTEMPKLRVASSPSNSTQTKIAGHLLAEIGKRVDSEEINEAKVAVVLPDENLLLPMLYSLPEGMGDVNLTMGYSLKLTSVVPFVSLLRKLHNNIRMSSGEPGFYHRDLRLFLAHPFSHALFSSNTVGKIIGWLDRHHKSVMTLGELKDFSSEAARMLDPSTRGETPVGNVKYLDNVLETVSRSLAGMDGGIMKVRLERDHIEVYRDSLRRLSDILEEYDVKMKPSTVFYLADRLLAGETVGFDGEPLTGLQIMGTLETRSLDFDYLFILSMNERIMPRRARRRTFIPDSLRHAFGMPPANYAENIFSYYFYRMISRAREVTMLYDGRTTGGLAAGDVSRYIVQLRHLFAEGKIEEQDWKFMLSGKTSYDPSVEKNQEIRRMLEEYEKEGGRKNFSASSLNDYRECQAGFFFKNIMNINTDPAPSDYIDAIGVGNVIHSLMEHLYLPEEKRGRLLSVPVTLSKEFLDDIVKNGKGIESLITRIVNKVHYHLPEEELDTPLEGATKIVASIIKEQALKVVARDASLAPIELYGCEIKENMRIPLKSGRVVNFKFAIDRLDRIKVDGEWRMRIIDYKTGQIKLQAADMEEVMHGDYRSEQIFQLFTYAWLLEKKRLEGASEVMTEIYDVPKIWKNETNVPEINKVRVEKFSDCAEEFSTLMEQMLNDIFDLPVFKAVEDEESCRLCSLKTLCRR